jgi:hypothetical protein
LKWFGDRLYFFIYDGMNNASLELTSKELAGAAVLSCKVDEGNGEMKIFYYPATISEEAEECLKTLWQESDLPPLKVFAGGCQLNSTLSLELRNGDIIILFAANAEDLSALQDLHDDLDDFRTILILGEHCGAHFLLHYPHLHPRYVTTIDNVSEVTTVVKHMMSHERTVKKAAKESRL